MIAIINITDMDKPTGIQWYRLQINHKVILEFTHVREEGLAVCLEKAAMAVREQNLKEDRDMIGLLDKMAKR